MNLFVAQLQSESNPAERTRLVARIDAAVGSMNELFEALLDMTKLEAGILKPNPVRVLRSRGCSSASRPPSPTRRARRGCSLRVVASDAWVSSDPILLERILFNLVSNAVRYTERGGVVVGCRHRGRRVAHRRVRYRRRHSGGSAPAHIRRVLPAGGRRPDRNGGLGLGLAIVDRLGRLLGHTVELDSRPGRGSRFSVTVPLAAQPHAVE